MIPGDLESEAGYPRVVALLNDLRRFARYASELPGYLRRPLTPPQALHRMRERIETREKSFLAVLERGVYANVESPYLALLRHGGAEYGDVLRLVREGGLEGALERLHEAGVYITLEEFRGRRPIVRPGLEFPVRPADFDNPLATKAFVDQTGGSRGPGRPIARGFSHWEANAVYHSLFLQTFDFVDHPAGLWRPAPPGGAGLSAVLGFAKVGTPIERWFSQNRLTPGRPRELLLTAYTLFGGRLAGRRLAWPEYVPLYKAEKVASWLGEKKQMGKPPLLSTTSSSGVRVCLAARDGGLDISGTLFRFGGEPYTPARAKIVAEAGCRGVSNYSMTEIGRVGIACATPNVLDDLHLATDQLGVIQRERSVDKNGTSVDAFLFTTLLPSAPKLMLNVESDDYGVLETRSCGCLLGELGMTRHVHGVRSYEKLTSEGMTFIGNDLLDLVDQVLPSRFGGNPTDYQIVEEEVDGLPKVRIVVSPRVGQLDEDEIIAAVLDALSKGPSYKRMMADLWRMGETLRVVRREPYTTGSAAKILPLHILDSA